VKPRVNWTYGEVLPRSGDAHVYGWLPTSALANVPAPTDRDCRLGDSVDDYTFQPDPKDDYPHFFNVP
jgi:hypothetical protein